jgi:hypothetical protein
MDKTEKKNRPTGPQQINWPISWPRTALNSINLNTLMPNMYVDLEDKFHGVLWKKTKKVSTCHLGTKLTVSCPTNHLNPI